MDTDLDGAGSGYYAGYVKPVPRKAERKSSLQGECSERPGTKLDSLVSKLDSPVSRAAGIKITACVFRRNVLTPPRWCGVSVKLPAPALPSVPTAPLPPVTACWPAHHLPHPHSCRETQKPGLTSQSRCNAEEAEQ